MVPGMLVNASPFVFCWETNHAQVKQRKTAIVERTDTQEDA